MNPLRLPSRRAAFGHRVFLLSFALAAGCAGKAAVHIGQGADGADASTTAPATAPATEADGGTTAPTPLPPTAPPGASDGAAPATGDGSPPEGDGDSAADAAIVNGCTTFVDLTEDGANRTVSFGGPMVGPGYTPRCLAVRAGQSVTFNAPFGGHPLGIGTSDDGGALVTADQGKTANFTFPTEGTLPFRCLHHPATENGAILVVP